MFRLLRLESQQPAGPPVEIPRGLAYQRQKNEKSESERLQERLATTSLQLEDTSELCSSVSVSASETTQCEPMPSKEDAWHN